MTTEEIEAIKNRIAAIGSISTSQALKLCDEVERLQNISVINPEYVKLIEGENDLMRKALEGLAANIDRALTSVSAIRQK